MQDSPDAERWLRRAIALATENVKSGAGGPFGAVVVKGGQLVAEGVNMVTSTCDPTAHAEVTAIRRAGGVLGTHVLAGCEIYASCEPCPMCLGAILWARIDRVWYAATQAQATAAGFDDSDFYAELARPGGERRVAMIRSMAERAEEPFDAWREFSGRVQY